MENAREQATKRPPYESGILWLPAGVAPPPGFEPTGRTYSGQDFFTAPVFEYRSNWLLRRAGSDDGRNGGVV